VDSTPRPQTGRLWPRWLEHQLDPAHPAFVPGSRVWDNTTGRRWTLLGTPTSTARVAVDECGLVWPIGATWAVDWWIGAEDRWRLPSREATVRQTLVGGEPVVETLVRVPGGDARSRVYVAAGPDGTDTVVLEVEADTAAPFALAWGLSPVTLEGRGRIDRIEVDDATVAVDGRPVLWLPGRPGRLAVAGADGWAAETAADIVLAGRAPTAPTAPAVVHGAEGAATAAAVFPVSHRSTIRARLVPPPPPLPGGRRRRRGASVPTPAPVEPPGADAVGRGWRALVDHAVRLVLPYGALSEAIERQRRHLALAAATVTEPDPVATRVLVAAAQAGLPSAAPAACERWFGGEASVADRITLPAAASLWALEALAAIDAVVVLERWLPRVAERAERLGRLGASAADVETAVWSRAGLRSAATLLAANGEAEAAGRVLGWLPADPPGPAPSRESAVGAGRVGGARPAALALLAAVGPLAPVDGVERARVVAELRASLSGGLVAVGDPARGLSPAATLGLAAAGAGPGPRLDEESERHVASALAAAGATGAWPEVVLPATGSGTEGAGHDAGAAAALWELGRSLLVGDPPGSAHLALAPLWPAAWWGAPLEVHGLPTRAGRLSYAVRWHGHRPALLWELTGGPGPVTVTSPGFDPAWSSADARGEALFDVEAPPGVEAPPDPAGEGGSFG
jgi:hypothetical protein